MTTAIDKLKVELGGMTPQELTQLFSPEELAEINYTLKDARCAERVASFDAGPLYFLTRLTRTENSQFEAQGLPFKAPFPKKSYFVPLFEAFLKRSKQLFVAKSRTMMSSWAAMGFAFWAAQWLKEETVVQTLSEDRVLHLIDYIRQLYDNQEPWLKQRHPIARRNAFTCAWVGGGEVSAIPSGADKIRTFHPTTYIQDESAFMLEGREALSAVIPTGSNIICISSAAPGWFGEACAL